MRVKQNLHSTVPELLEEDPQPSSSVRERTEAQIGLAEYKQNYDLSHRDSNKERRRKRRNNERDIVNIIQQQCRELNRELINENRRNQRRSVTTTRAKTTEFSALIPNSENENIAQHFIGPMDSECQFCGALHFAAEGTSRGSGSNKRYCFTNCCTAGKIDCLQPFEDMPHEFQELFANRQFMDNIRSYNSSIAMASCGGKIDNVAPGPFVFRVHGQLYHRSGPLHPNDKDSPSYAQLYVFDSEQASDIKMQNPANEQCEPNILSFLHDYMIHNNRLVQSYRMLKEVEDEMIENGMDTKNLRMKISINNNFDPRRYNIARSNEIAMVFTDDDGCAPHDRDIRVYLRHERKTQNISILAPHLDSLTYPLFFPKGDSGWHKDLKRTDGKKVTEMDYFSYHLQVRRNRSNFLLKGGKLTHQIMVDWYTRMEANRLYFIRINQKKLKAENYAALHEYVQQRANETGREVGRTIVLPATYIGSPRNMQQRYQDAMAIVRVFGKPDLFVTVTCNPTWPEIKDNLLPGQTAQDRPDLVARVFRLKLKEIIDDIHKSHVFGKSKAFCYTIEFQKRGLPHAHILWIGGDLDLKDANVVDNIVSARIPNRVNDPRLYEIVKQHMLHGPCTSACKENGKCKKNFPKEFQECTDTSVEGFPLYRRPNDGSKIQKGNTEFTNQHVVPHNPYLLLKYNCHINVEVCTSVKAVKYIYKYIYKGHDCAEIVVSEGPLNVDEIDQHINARYVSAPEAMWRIFGFWMGDKSHTVVRLHVHEQNQQVLVYEIGDEEQALENMRDSNLTAYFKLNADKTDDLARTLLYSKIPNYYTWQNGRWQRRVNGFDANVIGRMYNVSPSSPERYALKLLLLNRKGAISFEDLRPIDGITYISFKEACVKLNLMESDEQWYHCMNEALAYQMPRQLRQLFAFVCIFGSPANTLEIYNHFKENLIEDFIRSNSEVVSEQLALQDIEIILKLHGKSGKDYNLPECQPYMTSSMYEIFDIEEEKTLHQINYNKLNEGQKLVVDTVLEKIVSGNTLDNCIHLNGPGGSGKTFVYETIMNYIRGNLFDGYQGIVIAVASTGIAATLLKGGRTCHSQFGIPLNANSESTSNLRTHLAEADRIRKSQVIIWDECTMVSKFSLDVVDKLLQEIMGNTKPFGGKLIILGGDFRQILNVVKRGNRVSTVQTNLKSSSVWRCFRTYKLSVNMRARNDEDFANWVLKLGNGDLNMTLDSRNDIVEIPSYFISSSHLIDEIFGGINESNVQNYGDRAILCPLNEDSFNINNDVLELLPGDEKVYKSVDSIDCATRDDSSYYPIEYLHTQTPSGMPNHIMKLKVGAIVMLLRNLNTKRGLCNGTRLIITQLQENVIFATVLTGRAAGEALFIPRITLTSSDGDYPFILKRRQFPIRVSFAMTINKSQGQSFDKVGIYLRKPVFSHGQLYVAFSRGKSKENIKVVVTDSAEQGEIMGEGEGTYTSNCVFKEVL